MCIGGDVTGGAGSGLFRSEFVLVLKTGEEATSSDAEKSEKETVCGARAETGFPCLCFGGGGFFFSGFFKSATKPTLSSSEAAISYDVRGDSASDSWTGSNTDCRDVEDVLLLLSKIDAVTGLGAVAVAGCEC